MTGRARLLLVVAIAVLAMATTAHAASLPVQPASLLAFRAPASPLPTQLVGDTFDTGSVLDGRVTATGQTWRVVRGNLSLTGGQVRCTSCNGTLDFAIVDAGVAEVSATVDVIVSGSAAGGVVLTSDQNANQAIMAWYSGNQVQVRRYSGTVPPALLAQATVSGVPAGSTVALTATYRAGTYTVAVNGQTALTHALSAADRAVFDVRTYVGVVLYDANGGNRLDNFVVTP